MYIAKKLSIFSIFLSTSVAAGSVFAENMDGVKADESVTGTAKTSMDAEMSPKELTEQRQDSTDLLKEAKTVVNKMKNDQGIPGALSTAKALYIVPDYGKGSLVAGVQGGQGVLFTQNAGEWGSPVFYNTGAISLGAQAGIEVGEIAFLLMTDEALDAFRNDGKFALNADAGLTIADWSAQARETIGEGGNDVILWSDTEGVFAGGAISVSKIFADDDANEAYYGKEVSVADVIDGDFAETRN